MSPRVNRVETYARKPVFTVAWFEPPSTKPVAITTGYYKCATNSMLWNWWKNGHVLVTWRYCTVDSTRFLEPQRTRRMDF